jgi:plastocyanin
MEKGEPTANMTSGKRMLIVAALFATTSCAGLPTTSRTGAVHDVLIKEEEVFPHELIVQAGDEIRWINQRTIPVWVYFYKDSLDEVVCQRGFSYFWGMEEFAKVEPQQSVSVCFAHVDAVSYRIQREATVIRGSTAGEGGSETIPVSMHGAILIEEPTSYGSNARLH